MTLTETQLRQMAETYAPYHRYEAFYSGQVAYGEGRFDNPFPLDSVYAQAWDRGLEFGMRIARSENDGR